MLSSIAMRLYIYAKIPAAWDAVVPMGPKFSAGAINVVGSQIVKSVSQSIQNRELGETLNSLGKELYSEGVSSMSYDDDNWCGTPPIPLPHHIFLEPIPHPWFENIAVASTLNKRYYGGVLSIIAQTILNQRVASQLQDIANKLMTSER